MPIIKSAIKRARQTEKRRARNIETKKSFRSAVKAFLAKPTAKGLQEAQSEIDTAVKKKVIEKNSASRKKSQLAKVAKAAGVKPAKGAEKKTAPKAAPKATAAKKPAAKKTETKAPAKKPAAKTAAKKPAAKKPAAKK